MYSFRGLIVLITIFVTSVVNAEESKDHTNVRSKSPITCGSAIRLRHIDTSRGKGYFLNSEAFSWGQSSGSGQQIVTLQKATNKYQSASSTTLWQVQEAYSKETCVNGEPIKCGDTIRLMHINTQKWLHTHHIPSVLSKHHQEVSAFGSGKDGRSSSGAGDSPDKNHLFTDGDKLDNWQLLCSGAYWRNGDIVKLKHIITGALLGSSPSRLFTHSNCPNCPVIDHLEVYGSSKDESSSSPNSRLYLFETKQAITLTK